jgi:hypothetical protein
MISLSPPSYLTGRSAVRRRSGPPGNRTPITWVQTRRLPIGLAARVNCVVVLSVLCPFSSLSFQLEVRSGIEPDLRPYQRRVRPEHSQTFSLSNP